ncbi:deoxynucleoside kinase [Piscinibacter koreensis]|uniref:Deoxynucleoside kinase n=1 Tax=Piscinibacter koreensis TaxID=2742824 RepID=A0A7Y6NPU4_9BURK|nr:deoxynucleoside kinase [Schlegelella koreensis]NUZ07137.1 deoxynucleoside kinase [Schlegelella koreensis]
MTSTSTDLHAGGLQRFRHIAIEGPIGVGKSSLARRLAAHLGADLMLEQPAENPFLDRFYEDMPGYAFQTQLFFLFQRVKQVQALAQPGMFSHAVVADFVFAKDALFAKLTLSDDEHRLYTQMYAQVAPQVGDPDLVIWLQASPDTLMQRIARRGLPMERAIEPAYLQRICDAYAEYFERYDGPLFVLGTERFNPVDRDADFHALVERLERFGGPRESFDAPGAAPLV